MHTRQTTGELLLPWDHQLDAEGNALIYCQIGKGSLTLGPGGLPEAAEVACRSAKGHASQALMKGSAGSGPPSSMLCTFAIRRSLRSRRRLQDCLFQSGW